MTRLPRVCVWQVKEEETKLSRQGYLQRIEREKEEKERRERERLEKIANKANTEEQGVG